MRQAGVLAAAGLYALTHNVNRLPEDHARARMFAERIAGVRGISVDLGSVQTNIVIIDVSSAGQQPPGILASLRARGVLLTPGNYMGLRAVTHMDVTTEQVERAAGILSDVMTGR